MADRPCHRRRRPFSRGMPTIVRLAARSAAALVLAGLLARGAEPPADAMVFHPGARILFQGDSITDGGRWRNSSDPNHFFGQCYAYLLAARFGAWYPNRHLTFFNRGISGNRIDDLLARWPRDTLALKPDLVSILVGVNDVLIPMQHHQRVSPSAFAASYDRLLAETVKALPGVKLVLGEPYIEPGPRTSGHWEAAQHDIHALQKIVFELGAKYHAPVVPYQRMFDAACRRAPVKTWVWDGVHPTAAGHELMADEWIRVVRATWPH